MDTRDWASLGFTPTLNFALPNERQLAQSSLADAGKGAEYKFNPTAVNAQLLASLGYSGQGLGSSAPDEWGNSGPQWSDDARTWLANNGYTVGVAHDPNTSPGGRPEYYGLVDKNGNYVAGQDDPTMTMSDTMGDQVAMFATFLGPVLGGIATAGSAAGGAGAAAGAGAGEAGALGGGAAGAGSGLVQGSSNLWDLVGQGALKGAGTGAIKGIATGQNPLESALKGALGGAIGGGISSIGQGSLGNLFGGLDAGSGSMDIIPDAFGGASGAATDGLLQNVGSFGDAAGSVGGGMDWSGVGDWFSNWSPDSLNLTQDITGNVLTQDLPTFSGGGLWNPDYLNLLQGIGGGDYSNEGRNYSGPGGLDPATNSPVNSGGSSLLDGLLGGIKGAVGSAAGAVGGGQNLAALIGAGLGAASGGGTQTSSRDPWSAAQPFLKNLLGDADTMRANLAQQPFTPQQMNAYQQAFSGLDQARGALPGLLSWGQQAMGRQSTTPSYDQLFGGGLLNQQPQQPTAQAGGAGGLLGNDDRIKTLMARGRGLIG